MDARGRKELFRAVVGSHNYNLNTVESDRDYKVFVAPTFDDLYFNKSFSSSHIGETEDYDIHDIRKVSELWWKSNINFIEVLFSECIVIAPDLRKETKDLIMSIFKDRDALVSMNLPYLYNACIGMHLNKMKLLEKGTSGTMHLVEQYGYDCYSEDTMFLTSNGWKLYDEITGNDLLGTVNPNTHNLEFQNYYERIKKEHKGVMYEMDNAFSNCLVTGNHRMYTSPIVNRNKLGISYKHELSNWGYNSMENLIQDNRSYFHVLTTPNNNNLDYEISDDLLKIIGLYVSEGTLQFRRNKIKSVKITQTDNGKQELFEMMDNIKSFNFKKYDYEKETIWNSHDKELVKFLYENCGHKSENKRLPKFINKLSKRQSILLMLSLNLGDGTVKKIGDKIYGVVYYTINKKLAEDIQILALLCEKNSLLWGGDNGYHSISNFNGEDLLMYQVYIKDKVSNPKMIIFKPYSQKGNSSCSRGIKTIDYEGNIVCFSVPNENLITQRKGKIAIQGNTKQGMHAFRVLDFLKRFADAGFCDFKSAISYEGKDRERILSIKDGKFTLAEFEKIANELLFVIRERYESIYYNEKVNQEAYKKLTEIIKRIVKEEIGIK